MKALLLGAGASYESGMPLAECLGVSIATVRRRRRDGHLGYVCIGRKVFTTEDQIKDFIRRGRRDVGEPDCPTEEGIALSNGAEVRSRWLPRTKLESRGRADALTYAYELSQHVPHLETPMIKPRGRVIALSLRGSYVDE